MIVINVTHDGQLLRASFLGNTETREAYAVDPLGFLTTILDDYPNSEIYWEQINTMNSRGFRNLPRTITTAFKNPLFKNWEFTLWNHAFNMLHLTKMATEESVNFYLSDRNGIYEDPLPIAEIYELYKNNFITGLYTDEVGRIIVQVEYKH